MRRLAHMRLSVFQTTTNASSTSGPYCRRSAVGGAKTSSEWLSSHRAYVRAYPVAPTKSSKICCFWDADAQ